MVAAHEIEIAAGAAAARRPGVAPRRIGLALGILRPLAVALSAMISEQVDMIAPALFQIRVKQLEIARAVVDVAIGDGQTAGGGGAGGRIRHLQVHRLLPLRFGPQSGPRLIGTLPAVVSECGCSARNSHYET